MRGHFGSRWEQQVVLLRLLFEKAMALQSGDVEMDSADTESQHKGKGGIRLGLKGTTEHFETKYLEAVKAENQVRKALTIDDDVDMVADRETLASKTFMDSMEPEAHVNWPPISTSQTPSTVQTSRRPSGGWQSQTTAPGRRQGCRGGAGLGRGVPPQRFQPATSTHTPTKSLEIQRGETDKYKMVSLPESFPYLDEDAKRLGQHMSEKEFGNLFLNFSPGMLDSIVVKRIIETYAVQKSRQTMNNFLHQPHRRQGDRSVGAKARNEDSGGKAGGRLRRLRRRMEGHGEEGLDAQRQKAHAPGGLRGQGDGQPARHK